MKVAVIGSRNLTTDNIGIYLPENTDEIISGGAKGIDACAKKYALLNGIKYKEFLPEYDKYGKVAPLKRNLEIINYANMVIAFWDGESRGTKFVIDNCLRENKAVKIIEIKNNCCVDEK